MDSLLMSILAGIKNKISYRWYILTLVSLTATLVLAMPMMAMPVLFKEISEELNLNLVQVGTIWGIVPLAGMFVVLLGGLMSDRFGAKRILVAGCLLTGLSGILRGLSDSFITLVATMFLFGLVSTFLGPGMIKACSTWFSEKRLGLANGVLSMSWGLGFMIGAMISAMILSPLLGGWRNVMFFFGGLSIIVGILWLFSRSAPNDTESTTDSTETVPFRQSFSMLIRNRSVWLLGLVLFGQMSCVQGMLGYLPLYLRDAGWQPNIADGALSAFHATSTLAAIPIAVLSDRLGLRKPILVVTTLATAVGVGLLSIASGWGVWVSVIIAGVVRDGFMAVQTTMVIESEGVGPKYTGTAMGIVHTLTRVGEFISPPIGNGLAGISPRLSFAFWSGLATMALFVLYFVKEKPRDKE